MHKGIVVPLAETYKVNSVCNAVQIELTPQRERTKINYMVNVAYETGEVNRKLSKGNIVRKIYNSGIKYAVSTKNARQAVYNPVVE